MLSRRRILRSLAVYWAVFLASWLLTEAAALVYLLAGGGSRDAVLNAATVGIRNVSLPIMKQAESAGLPEFMWFMLVNGAVTLVLFSLPLLLTLLDPAKRNRPPRLLRRFVLNDPTLVVFKPLPVFRRIPLPELQPLFAALVAAPLVAPVLAGVMVGLVTSIFVDAADPARTVLFGATLILPHGVFELTALFLSPACMLSLYRELREDVEGGRTAAVWEGLYRDLRWGIWLRRLAVALALITVAGAVEAYLTVPFARAVASWMGLDAGI